MKIWYYRKKSKIHEKWPKSNSRKIETFFRNFRTLRSLFNILQIFNGLINMQFELMKEEEEEFEQLVGPFSTKNYP